MASHDDTRNETVRSRRKFRPEIGSPLERREVMTASGVPATEVPDATAYVVTETPPAAAEPDQAVTTTSLDTSTPYGDIATTSVGSPVPGPGEMATTGRLRPVARPGAATPDWSTMAGWSWLGGVWKSKTRIDFMDTLARSMGARNMRFPAIPSMDTWMTQADSYVGRTALGAQQQAMPLDGLVIRPGGTSGTTTLSMTSADGSAPVELPLTSSSRNSATFTGVTPIFESVNDGDGQETVTTGNGAPVRVSVVKRSATSMRITAEMQTGGKWTRMFTYTATKSRTGSL